jgi:L-seryl-tRNA(Ser) seleniumtransferase
MAVSRGWSRLFSPELSTPYGFLVYRYPQYLLFMAHMSVDLRERFRCLPGVDAVLSALESEGAPAARSWLTELARAEIGSARERIRACPADGPFDPELYNAAAIARRVQGHLAVLARPNPDTVINATGILLHTNLGRAPLSEAAVRHMAQVAANYSDLEFDLERGERGSRQDHVRELLSLLTGAEDAMVVNNNAAAVLLALGALARGKEVIISRGELVEIGGSFRIPEILEQSGAVLKEVGTTNRTHLRDYENALGPGTGLLLRVHQSNYRIEGFTAEVPLSDLVALGAKRGVPVMVDLGSGAFVDVTPSGLRPEPLVHDVVQAGPHVVTLSGDKLLGGPQAGIVVGRKDTVERMRKHPLARAVRIDKMMLAALQSTLASYLDESRARRDIPVLSMLFESEASVRHRAEALAAALGNTFSQNPAPRISVEAAEGAVGGGTLPVAGLPTAVVALDPRPHTTGARFERALRAGAPPLLARIQDERVLIDVRTVLKPQEPLLPGLLKLAWQNALGKGEP